MRFGLCSALRTYFVALLETRHRQYRGGFATHPRPSRNGLVHLPTGCPKHVCSSPQTAFSCRLRHLTKHDSEPRASCAKPLEYRAERAETTVAFENLQ